jgi:autotransporter-associated beta strand protein
MALSPAAPGSSFTFDFQHPDGIGSSFADAIPLSTLGAGLDRLGRPIGFTQFHDFDFDGNGRGDFLTLTSAGLEFETGAALGFEGGLLGVPFPTDGIGTPMITARFANLEGIDQSFEQAGVHIGSTPVSVGDGNFANIHQSIPGLDLIYFIRSGPGSETQPGQFSQNATLGGTLDVTLTASTISGGTFSATFEHNAGMTSSAALGPLNDELGIFGNASSGGSVVLWRSFGDGFSGTLTSVTFSAPNLKIPQRPGVVWNLAANFDDEVGLPVAWSVVDNHPGPNNPAFSLTRGTDQRGQSAGQAGHIGNNIDGLGGNGQAVGGWLQAPSAVPASQSWQLTFAAKFGSPNEDIRDDATIVFGDLGGRNHYALVLTEFNQNNDLFYYHNDERAGPNPLGISVINTESYASGMVDNTWYRCTLNWNAASKELSFDIWDLATGAKKGSFHTVLDGTQVVFDPQTMVNEIVNPAPTGLVQFGFGTLNDNATYDVLRLIAFSHRWIAAGGGNWTDVVNWAGDDFANGPEAQALFGNVLSAPATVTIDADITVSQIIFNHGPHSYTLAGDGVHAITLAGEAIIDAAGISHTISAPLVGGGSLTTMEAGTIILSGANTYTGTTTVRHGTLLVNGTHSGGSAYTVTPGATLGGNGTIHAAIFNDGTVAPGSSAGTLHVDGDYTQASSGRLAIELASESSFDLLEVTGSATLNGALVVSLIEGFIPAQDDAFMILAAESVAGTLDESVLPALTEDLAWKVLYETDSVSLISYLPGDFNRDGNTDAADYVVWRDALNNLVPIGTGADGDFDGQITQADYDVWRSHFGSTAGVGAGSIVTADAPAAVPEPASVLLLILAATLTANRKLFDLHRWRPK